MAEALGIASGIAGLVSLTIEVIEISYKYISEVKGASRTVSRLVKELEDIKNVLQKIDEISRETDDQEIFGAGGSSLLNLKKSNDYVSLLDSLRDNLNKRMSDSSIRKRIKALTWPFTEEKTQALVESLHRHLETFTTALTIDTRYIQIQTIQA